MTLRQLIETNIDRKVMPQVDRTNLSLAVKLLRENGIRVTLEVVLATDLKYSQKTVDKAKVRNIIKDIKRGVKMPPLIISQDYFIVDGHHRCIAYRILDPLMEIKVIKIWLSKKEAILAWKEIEKKLDGTDPK